jgi:flagellar motor switch protein FliM
LRNFTSDNVEVSIDSMTSVRYGDYINSIPLPAIMAVFRAREWENFGLVTVESNLIYSIIDVLLGGGRGGSLIRVEGRPYTTIESNLVRQMIELLLEDMQRAFAPLTQIDFELERMETNPRFANISRPANAAMLIQLRIDMEDRGGNVEFLIPYSTIEPIRDLLLQAFMGEKFGRDLNWESHLASEVFQSELQLNAVLADQDIALREVLDLKVGQTIVFNRGPNHPVDLTCAGVSVTQGQMGRKGDYISVKVGQGLKPPKMSLAAFEQAAQSGTEK